MAVDTAIRSLADIAFRKYPSEVPQRCAYAVLPSASSVFRYAFREFMTHTLPDSNVLTIPFGHLPAPRPAYHEVVDKEQLQKLRRRRLAILVKEFRTQKALAEAADVEPNYISQLLNDPDKSFAEDAARNFERAARKPRLWLDTEDGVDPPPTEWPFSFDRSYWDRLEPSQQAEIESALQKLILGASVQDMAVKRPKRRSG